MRRRPQWNLTVRRGSQVERHEFESLEEAAVDMERLIQDAASEGNLPGVKAFRDYSPGMRIHARVEIGGRGLFRGPTAGIDLMGDGSLVPYQGAVRRKELEPEEGESPFDAVRRALA